MDYSEDLSSRISSVKKTLQALDSAYSKGLADKSDYLQEKEELEVLSKFLADVREKTLENLKEN
jgi:hypothetical protein